MQDRYAPKMPYVPVSMRPEQLPHSRVAVVGLAVPVVPAKHVSCGLYSCAEDEACAFPNDCAHDRRERARKAGFEAVRGALSGERADMAARIEAVEAAGRPQVPVYDDTALIAEAGEGHLRAVYGVRGEVETPLRNLHETWREYGERVGYVYGAKGVAGTPHGAKRQRLIAFLDAPHRAEDRIFGVDEKMWRDEGRENGWTAPERRAWPYRLWIVRHVAAMWLSWKVHGHAEEWSRAGIGFGGPNPYDLWCVEGAFHGYW